MGLDLHAVAHQAVIVVAGGDAQGAGGPEGSFRAGGGLGHHLGQQLLLELGLGAHGGKVGELVYPKDHAGHQGHGYSQHAPLAHLQAQLVEVPFAGHGALSRPGEQPQLGLDKFDLGQTGTHLGDLFPGGGKPAHAKAPGHASAVQQPYAAVHGEDSPAHPVGVGAKVAQQHGEQAASYAKQDLAAGGDRGGGVVGGHEDGTQHQPAAEELGQHPGHTAAVSLGEQEGEQSHGGKEGQRCPGLDDPAGH